MQNALPSRFRQRLAWGLAAFVLLTGCTYIAFEEWRCDGHYLRYLLLSTCDGMQGMCWWEKVAHEEPADPRGFSDDYRVHYRESPTGFVIAPQDVIPLASPHFPWNAGIGGHGDIIFADQENYYLATDDCSPLNRFSYYVRHNGLAIDGRTGRIRVDGVWRDSDFVLLSLDELKRRFPPGTTRAEVLRVIGGPTPLNQEIPVLDIYWDRGLGEVWFEYEASKALATNASNRLKQLIKPTGGRI